MIKGDRPQLSLKLFSNVVPAKWMEERFIPPVYGGNMPPRSQANRISGKINHNCLYVTQALTLCVRTCTHRYNTTHTVHASCATICMHSKVQYSVSLC